MEKKSNNKEFGRDYLTSKNKPAFLNRLPVVSVLEAGPQVINVDGVVKDLRRVEFMTQELFCDYLPWMLKGNLGETYIDNKFQELLLSVGRNRMYILQNYKDYMEICAAKHAMYHTAKAIVEAGKKNRAAASQTFYGLKSIDIEPYLASMEAEINTNFALPEALGKAVERDFGYCVDNKGTIEDGFVAIRILKGFIDHTSNGKTFDYTSDTWASFYDEFMAVPTPANYAQINRDLRSYAKIYKAGTYVFDIYKFIINTYNTLHAGSVTFTASGTSWVMEASSPSLRFENRPDDEIFLAALDGSDSVSEDDVSSMTLIADDGNAHMVDAVVAVQYVRFYGVGFTQGIAGDFVWNYPSSTDAQKEALAVILNMIELIPGVDLVLDANGAVKFQVEPIGTHTVVTKEDTFFLSLKYPALTRMFDLELRANANPSALNDNK